MTATDPEALAATVRALVAPELDPGYRRRVATVLEWIPPSTAVDAHLLDVGCGRGYVVGYYLRLGQRAVTGVEIDAALAARAAAAHRSSPAAAIVRADAAALPFPAQRFSGAVLSEVLEHVADDLAVLREVWRVLRPGAPVAITVPHARYPWAWDPINRTLAALRLPPVRHGPLAGIWAEHRRLYERAALRDVVRRAGFAIEAERSLVRHCLPFSHNLLYGIGKPLLESGWVPQRLARSIDRRRPAGSSNDDSRVAVLLRRLFSVGERWNRDDEGTEGPSVNLCIKARKPG